MLYWENFSEKIFWGNPVESYVWFFLILLFGVVLLRFLSRSFSQLLFKFFKRFAKEVKGEKFVELLLKPIELLVLVCTFYFAVNRLDYPLNEVFFKRKTIEITYLDAIDKIFLFFIIISIIWMFLRIIDFIALVFMYRASLTESKDDDQLVPFVKELAKILAGIIGVFVLLGMVFEINVLTLIAGLGVGGIAIALAAKESLENLLGSFTIFLDKPFVVGDLIRVDGQEGTIEKVGFRSTRVRSVDNSIITLPNKTIVDSALENLTLRNYRRLKFNIGLTYDTPSEKIKAIVADLHELVNNHEHTNDEGVVSFDGFGESSLNIQILYYIEMMNYNDYIRVKEDVNFKIVETIQKHNVSFAFPTRTILHKHSGDSHNME
jgi:MscS family membrane protein